MSNRILIRGGQVLSMDPDTGNLPKGDVLIEDDRIVAVQPSIDADAEVIDATGFIVIPGFIDTHRHTWEAAIRGCAPNATLDDYFVEVLDTFAPHYRPDDVYASNLAGSLECLNAGITTLVDWSHINNTAEHPDAAIRALQEVGIRAQYAYGSANTSLADVLVREHRSPSPATTCGGSATRTSPPTTACSRWRWPPAGPGFCKDEVVQAEWALARELGIPITVHVGMGRLAGRFGMVEHARTAWVCSGRTPRTSTAATSPRTSGSWSPTAAARSAIAPQVEVQMGHGWPPVVKAMEYGLRPSLSIDVVTTVPGDMFTQIRSAFGTERARVNAVYWEKQRAGRSAC